MWKGVYPLFQPTSEFNKPQNVVEPLGVRGGEFPAKLRLWVHAQNPLPKLFDSCAAGWYADHPRKELSHPKLNEIFLLVKVEHDRIFRNWAGLQMHWLITLIQKLRWLRIWRPYSSLICLPLPLQREPFSSVERQLVVKAVIAVVVEGLGSFIFWIGFPRRSWKAHQQNLRWIEWIFLLRVGLWLRVWICRLLLESEHANDVLLAFVLGRYGELIFFLLLWLSLIWFLSLNRHFLLRLASLFLHRIRTEEKVFLPFLHLTQCEPGSERD